MSSKMSEDAPKTEDREPYDKPSIAWEEPMDVRPNLIALCGKMGSDSACVAAASS